MFAWRKPSAIRNAASVRMPVDEQEFLSFLATTDRLDQAAVERATRAKAETHQRIDVVIQELGLLSADDLHEALSAHFKLACAKAADFPEQPIDLASISTDYLWRHRLVPLASTELAVTFATANCFAHDVHNAIAFHLERPIELILAPPRLIEQELARLYPGGSDRGTVVGPEPDYISDDDVQRLKDVASEAPVIRNVNRILSAAVQAGASDIHLEPTVSGLRVRFRIDGLTTDVETLPRDSEAGVSSRIKLMAKLNIAERRLPQDGRANFVVDGEEIDFRISTIPVLHGESIVLRILDRRTTALDFKSLGFFDADIATLKSLLVRPNGIVLVTGPTGSGKTTTLYAGLKSINAVERTIFSIEDPIEYELAGINQIQIKPAIGLDFAQCLRSVLRQDPDVIMVGELRDTETARVAIQASLTGHLVLATLHTNSAATAITRLIDMGVDDYLIASTLAGVLAQRLVRRVCEACHEVAKPADTVIPMNSVKRPPACPICKGSGYAGRTVINELLVVDDDLRSLIKAGIADAAIQAAAVAKGMTTLADNGMIRAKLGQTSVSEVLRATRL